MINGETRSAIRAFLGGFIQGLAGHHYFEPRQTVMREARAVCVSFEECARLIALQTYVVAERGYKASGKMPAAAAAKIEEIVSRINEGQTPDFSALIAEVLQASDEEWVERPAIADLYLKDQAGHEFFLRSSPPGRTGGNAWKWPSGCCVSTLSRRRTDPTSMLILPWFTTPMAHAWKTIVTVSAYSIWICKTRCSWARISGR